MLHGIGSQIGQFIDDNYDVAEFLGDDDVILAGHNNFLVQFDRHLRECLLRVLVARDSRQFPALFGAEAKALRILSHGRAE